jgi:hypothetical protein
LQKKFVQPLKHPCRGQSKTGSTHIFFLHAAFSPASELVLPLLASGGGVVLDSISPLPASLAAAFPLSPELASSAGAVASSGPFVLLPIVIEPLPLPLLVPSFPLVTLEPLDEDDDPLLGVALPELASVVVSAMPSKVVAQAIIEPRTKQDARARPHEAFIGNPSRSELLSPGHLVASSRGTRRSLRVLRSALPCL